MAENPIRRRARLLLTRLLRSLLEFTLETQRSALQDPPNRGLMQHLVPATFQIYKFSASFEEFERGICKTLPHDLGQFRTAVFA